MSYSIHRNHNGTQTQKHITYTFTNTHTNYKTHSWQTLTENWIAFVDAAVLRFRLYTRSTRTFTSIPHSLVCSPFSFFSSLFLLLLLLFTSFFFPNQMLFVHEHNGKKTITHQMVWMVKHQQQKHTFKRERKKNRTAYERYYEIHHQKRSHQFKWYTSRFGKSKHELCMNSFTRNEKCLVCFGQLHVDIVHCRNQIETPYRPKVNGLWLWNMHIFIFT